MRMRVVIAAAAGAALAAAGITACDFETGEAPPSDAPWFNGDGEPYCWIFDCPLELGATVCGTCVHPGNDHECPPGFVCACSGQCIKGPRSYDARPVCDGPPPAPDGVPDAYEWDWPACDPSHMPAPGP